MQICTGKMGGTSQTGVIKCPLMSMNVPCLRKRANWKLSINYVFSTSYRYALGAWLAPVGRVRLRLATLLPL